MGQGHRWSEGFRLGKSGGERWVPRSPFSWLGKWDPGGRRAGAEPTWEHLDRPEPSQSHSWSRGAAALCPREQEGD